MGYTRAPPRPRLPGIRTSQADRRTPPAPSHYTRRHTCRAGDPNDPAARRILTPPPKPFLPTSHHSCCESNANSTAGPAPGRKYLVSPCLSRFEGAGPPGRPSLQKHPGPPEWVTNGRCPARGYQEPQIRPCPKASPKRPIRHKGPRHGFGVPTPVLGTAPSAVQAHLHRYNRGFFPSAEFAAPSSSQGLGVRGIPRGPTGLLS